MKHIRYDDRVRPVLKSDEGADRWHALQCVRDTAATLELTPRDVGVLSALLSRLPAGQITAGTALIVFASNDDLALRANMSERTLRRGLEQLIAAGLIERRDSANRKRFPIRARSGEIIDAYGIDLRPLFNRLRELEDLAARAAIEDAETRAVRARILARRRQMVEMLVEIPEELSSWLAEMGRMLRRKLDRRQLSAIATELEQVIERNQLKVAQKTVEKAPPNQSQAQEMTVTDGQTGRHIESHSLSIKKETSHDDLAWKNLRNLVQFFPNEPRASTEVSEILQAFARMLRIRPLIISEVTERFTPWAALKLFDHLIGKGGSIRSPQAYTLGLLKREATGAKTILAAAANQIRMANACS